MKELILVRHAKSSWANSELRDINRPLNKRGKRDAPFMAAYCRQQGIVPDALFSSTAVRAFRTAKWFFKEFKKENVCFYKESDLYFGSEEDWLDLINNTDEQINIPAFFSHHPTITYFANKFTTNHFENVPTCGIIHLRSSANTWKELHFNNTTVKNFYFPKLVSKL